MTISTLPFALNAAVDGAATTLPSGSASQAQATDSAAFQPLLASLQAAGADAVLPANISPPLVLDPESPLLPAGNGLPLAGMPLPLDHRAPDSTETATADEGELTDSSVWPIGLAWTPQTAPARTVATATTPATTPAAGGTAMRPPLPDTDVTGAVDAALLTDQPLETDAATTPAAALPAAAAGTVIPSAAPAASEQSFLARRPASQASGSVAATPLAAAATPAPAGDGRFSAAPPFGAQLASASMLPAAVSPDTALRVGELVEQLDTAADAMIDTPLPGTAAREAVQRGAQAQAATALVQVPVGKPGWSEAVFDKVMWFSAQHLNSAEIQLSPPELGPMQVRVTTHNEQTSVYFSSHHAQVREALDQALPRLRELFDSQGLQLSDAGVGERSFAEQRASQQGRQNGERGETSGLADEVAVGETLIEQRQTVGLLDAYA